MLVLGSVEAVKLDEGNDYWIEWAAFDNGAAPYQSISSFNFKILASEDFESAFVYIKDPAGVDVVVDGNVASFYHYTSRQYNFTRYKYFKVQAIEKATPLNTMYSGIASDGSNGDGISKTLINNERRLLNRYVGTPFKIFKKRQEGARCTECWDPNRQQRKKSSCATCNGSGYISGGFYYPISTQISTDTALKKNMPSETAEEALIDLRARMTNYPIVRPKDLLLNVFDGRRFIIVNVTPTELPNRSKSRDVYSKLSYTVSQILDLKELHPEDSEYSVMSSQLAPKD
jgi:hypothetical protein